LWYNVSATKPNTSQKGEKLSCRKLYHLVVQNATTIIHSIATAKTLTVIRNTNAETASINLHPNVRGRKGQILNGNIRRVLYAEKLLSCTMTTAITVITVAVIRAVIIRFLLGKTQPSKVRPCQNCLANMISSVCVTLFI
jgi:hypothetical protein